VYKPLKTNSNKFYTLQFPTLFPTLSVKCATFRGFARFTVSKVLNHASDTGGAAAVTGVYDQNEYLGEKRRALDAWALRLLEVVEGKQQSDNVVRIR